MWCPGPIRSTSVRIWPRMHSTLPQNAESLAPKLMTTFSACQPWLFQLSNQNVAFAISAPRLGLPVLKPTPVRNLIGPQPREASWSGRVGVVRPLPSSTESPKIVIGPSGPGVEMSIELKNCASTVGASETDAATAATNALTATRTILTKRTEQIVVAGRCLAVTVPVRPLPWRR